MMRSVPLYAETPESLLSLFPSTTEGHKEKVAIYKPGSETSSDLTMQAA